MEHIEQDPVVESSSNSKPENLLEERWFFGNLLDRKTKKAILRCYSDPSSSSSSSFSQETMLARNSSGGSNSVSMKKFSHDVDFNTSQPFPLPCTVVKGNQVKEVNITSKSIPEPSRHTLLRTPSLPPCMGKEDDVESDFALSKLIRQASLNHSGELPPRRNSKVMKQTSSTPRHNTRRNPEQESIDSEACNEMRRLRFNQSKIMRKSLSDFEFKQGKRFKDLSLNLEQKYSNSGLPIPSWVDNKSSSAEDMKAQIMFWARAVAANVR